MKAITVSIFLSLGAFFFLSCNGNGKGKALATDTTQHSLNDSELKLMEKNLSAYKKNQAANDSSSSLKDSSMRKRPVVICDPAQQLGPNEDILQFGFALDGIRGRIADGDNWYLHRIYSAGAVGMLLAIDHTVAGTKEYFKGNVPCPRVCGVNDFKSIEPCLKGFLDDATHNLTSIPESTANDLLRNSQANTSLVYTLAIRWGKILQSLKDNADAKYFVFIYQDSKGAGPVLGLPNLSVALGYLTNGSLIGSGNWCQDRTCFATAGQVCDLIGTGTSPR